MDLHENNVSHLNDFIALNEQWITRHFEIESYDIALAKNPVAVINNGGFIFTVTIGNDNKVAGCCALFNEGDGVYELARMAVAPEFQRSGLGQTVLNACLSKAKSLQIDTLYLVSNTQLTAALRLYQKNGFSVVQDESKLRYSRANIVMRWLLPDES